MRHVEIVAKTNKTLTSFSLKNTGSKGASLGQFFVALKENNAFHVEQLFLAGNSLDV